MRTTVLTGAAVLLLGVSACGGSSAANHPLETPATANAAGTGSTAEPAKTITVTISGKQVTPEPADIQVAEGALVKLTVTSDRVDEVHVHGIDKEMELAPNTPGTMTFIASPAGSYEVETHKSNLLLFHLNVTG